MLARIPGVTVEKADLLCGDYAIGGDILGIERKTAADFVNSILDNRLMEQVARLTTEYQQAIVLIEGCVYSTRSSITNEALDGALSWLALLSDIKVLHTPDTTRTAQRLHRLGLHLTHGLGYPVPLRASKPKNLDISARFLVEGLPSCGPATAMKLLAHFGSPAAVFAATDAEWRQVSGVGPKLIDKMRTVLEFSGTRH